MIRARGRRGWICGAALIAAGLLGTAAPAQARGLDIQNYRPVLDGKGYFGVPNAENPGAWRPILGVHVNYARRPLELTQGDQRVGAVIDNMTTLDLTLALGMSKWVSVGLGIPLTLLSGAPEEFDGTEVQEGGLGDIHGQIKGTFLDPKEWPVGLAGRLDLRIPSATADLFLGGNAVRVGGGIIVDARFSIVTVALDLGYTAVLSTEQVVNFDVDDIIKFGLGVGVEPGGIFRRWQIIGELTGSTLSKDPFGTNEVQNPLEFRVGFKRDTEEGLDMTLGAGAGLTRGAGSPTFRLVLGLSWDPLAPGEGAPAPEIPIVADADGDGINDDIDACPAQPEDKDGFDDENGCPDPDNDEDGVLDEKDQCPRKAEDKDGFDDEDGCPDPDNDKDGILDVADGCPDAAEDLDGDQDDDGCPDAARDGDGDGIIDEKDGCPADPEDKDGWQDEDGCPDNDNDHDGLKDADDQCPNAAEDLDNFADLDGCPDPDNDKDGIPDKKDQCPMMAEDLDGFEDDDGCAEAGPAKVVITKKAPPPPPKTRKVVITGKKIEIKESIFFARGSARILTKKSSPILQEIATVLRGNPWIEEVLVEGHTDASGNDASNMRLSQRRAESVRVYLIDLGVEPTRLKARGYGETRPIADNKTRKGRAKNRRVEFRILKQSPPNKVIEVPGK